MYGELKMCIEVQLIYALESDSATLGRAYTAINDMSTQVAAALDNPALSPYATEVSVNYLIHSLHLAHVLQIHCASCEHQIRGVFTIGVFTTGW